MTDDVETWAVKYSGGKSIPQIADEYGVSRSRVRTKLLTFGVCLRSRVEGMKLALPRRKYQKTRKPFTEEHRAKISAARIAHAEIFAKGVSLKSSGYLEHTRGPNKVRSVHRTKMEDTIVRPLLSTELVHHDDENRSNNSDENLEIMSRSEHSRLHALRNINSRERDENGRFR